MMPPLKEILKKIKVPFLSLVVLFGAYLGILYFGIQDRTVHIADFSIPNLKIIDNLFFTLSILLSVKISYDLINLFVNRYTERIASKDHISIEKFLPLIDTTVKLFVILTGLTILMGHFNYNFGSVIAALGIGSLAIGLAAKDTLANTISGLIIMIDRPFKLNDRIKLASGKTGNVVSIGLRSVRLKDQDHNIIIIPNTELVNMQLVNLSQPDTRLRHQLKLNVACGTDLEKVRALLKSIAGRVEWVIQNPPPEVLFSGFGRFGLSVILRFWVEVEQQEKAVDAVSAEISKRFKEEQIEIPFQAPIYFKPSDHADEHHKIGTSS
jgi:small-conductance mechanosensitive channel